MNNFSVSDSDLRGLIRRAELYQLFSDAKLRKILFFGKFTPQPSDAQWESFCQANALDRSDRSPCNLGLQQGMEERDLCIKLLLNDSLQVFMEQRYGPGLSIFNENDLDTVIYSLYA